MSEDERAFLRAICAEPGDDTPRLVFADWLQEHDRPERAEFIRVQVELARTECPHLCTPERCVCERHGLRRRERELLGHGHGWDPRANWAKWAGFVPADDRAGVKYARGFIWQTTLSAADWLTHADALTAAHPVERVTLTDDPDELFRGRPFLRKKTGDGWHHPEWPGVTFELPPPLTTFATHGGDIVAGGWVSPVTDLPEAPLGIH